MFRSMARSARLILPPDCTRLIDWRSPGEALATSAGIESVPRTARQPYRCTTSQLLIGLVRSAAFLKFLSAAARTRIVATWHGIDATFGAGDEAIAAQVAPFANGDDAMFSRSPAVRI